MGDSNLGELIQSVCIYIIPLIFAITVHEASHAKAAYMLGDDTASLLGRTSLNPARHIDPVGTILMPLFFLIMTQGMFTFGYAKPVPVNPVRIRKTSMSRGMQIVALAGPLSNLVMAFIWAVLFAVVMKFTNLDSFFQQVCQAGIAINLSLFAFNLFPLLPLDGGRVLNGFLSRNLSNMFEKNEPYGIWIVIILSYTTPIIYEYWMRPIISFLSLFLFGLMSFI